MTVRPAVPADEHDVLALASMMATSSAALDSPGVHLLVAEVDATVAGYVLGSGHPTFHANGPVAWVEEIAVARFYERSAAYFRRML